MCSFALTPQILPVNLHKHCATSECIKVLKHTHCKAALAANCLHNPFAAQPGMYRLGALHCLLPYSTAQAGHASLPTTPTYAHCKAATASLAALQWLHQACTSCQHVYHTASAVHQPLHQQFDQEFEQHQIMDTETTLTAPRQRLTHQGQQTPLPHGFWGGHESNHTSSMT